MRSNGKNAKLGQKDFLEFWEAPYISRAVEARNFKFGTQTEGGDFQRKKCKIGSKGVMGGSRDQICYFNTPLIDRERLKLKTQTEGGDLQRKKFKIGSKRVTWGSRDPILEFWDP